MLPRLRLHRFIRGNYKQHEIDSARARQHIAYESLVSPFLSDPHGLLADILAPLGIPKHPFEMLRFGLHAIPFADQIPLLATLALGGLPLLYDLLRKLLRREFGSDLLGGISIIASILLGEYLAGTAEDPTPRRKR